MKGDIHLQTAYVQLKPASSLRLEMIHVELIPNVHSLSHLYLVGHHLNIHFLLVSTCLIMDMGDERSKADVKRLETVFTRLSKAGSNLFYNQPLPVKCQQLTHQNTA